MKRIVYTFFLTGIILGLGSCSKFLTVQPIDRLSDASFWKTQQDVESAVADVYGHLLDILDYGPYIPMNGDVRTGDFQIISNFPCFDAVAQNALTDNARMSNPTRYKMTTLSNWYPFYQSIAESNIDIQRIPGVKALTPVQVKQYVAEVRFVRAFTYFFISRIYGDVPLYTEPYDKSPLARTPMLDVLKFCLSECEAIKDDLPWQYNDPTKWGVRAARGAVYALIANINMWMAGFDKANQTAYWQATADAVDAIRNSGYFQLLPIESTQTIFKGRTKESLFEFELNLNYGSVSKYVNIGQWTQHEPVVNYGSTSDGFFLGKYITKIFPPDEPDKRRDLWFYLPYANNATVMFLKQSNVTDPNNFLYDDNLIIFRYGGILLLGAEAKADIGMNADAITLVNMLRSRAEAQLYNASYGDLKNFIFHERERELIGEGVTWYDLVRTGRVTDPNECIDYLTPQQFNAGGWTWPIDPIARVNNPNITLNSYWTK